MENNIDKDIEFLKGKVEDVEAIENVLSELDKHQEAHKILVNLNSNLKSELEIYKKINKKLCETIDLLAEEKEAGYFCRAFIKSQQTCDNHETCAECIIDWARKEVEKCSNQK